MLSDWLRARRKALGLTQKELAEKAGVDQSAISRAERNADWNPESTTLAALERVLGEVPLSREMLMHSADAGLDAFLRTEQARDLQLAPEEIAAARRHPWFGPDEQPSMQAWFDYFRARRGLRPRG